ncbi:thioredoxin family protein [Thioalkalivibrio sp. HK1]|uniref:thioredoxin family protein n=1 Tax=Thioalkalivibrio sp. HK1 TaxID=1469245 RepID=UPI00046E675F|nr:hypothetical protein [Thioalkalivibrio sp. HK1]
MDAIPLIDDLADFASKAIDRRLPIVLLVSRSDCSYCMTLKEQVLDPIAMSGEYEDKALLGELMLDAPQELIGFDGTVFDDRDDFARRFDALFTPTLLFLAPDGSELAPRMRGINTLELFAFYLDRSIRKAGRTLSEEEI